jgi:hypothetical protein
MTSPFDQAWILLHEGHMNLLPFSGTTSKAVSDIDTPVLTVSPV